MSIKREFKLNIGAATIILVIVVFALSVFAVLSIKASNTDLILAKRMRDSIQNYYEADGKAELLHKKICEVMRNASEEKVEEIRQELPEICMEHPSQKEVIISYAVPVGQTASLEVVLSYYLEDKKGWIGTVTQWKVIPQEMGEYEFSGFEFWDGTLEEE